MVDTGVGVCWDGGEATSVCGTVVGTDEAETAGEAARDSPAALEPALPAQPLLRSKQEMAAAEISNLQLFRAMELRSL
ncbi:hypothetical protein D3C76_44040 [compost metagenome]